MFYEVLVVHLIDVCDRKSQMRCAGAGAEKMKRLRGPAALQYSRCFVGQRGPEAVSKESIRPIHQSHQTVGDIGCRFCLIVDCFAFAEPAAMSRHFKTADRDPLGHIIAPAQEQLRSEEHTSELQSPCNLVCRLLLEKKK